MTVFATTATQERAETLSARLALWFSCIGHSYSHLLTLLYLTVVLALEREWGLGYAELLQLSAVGAFLFGAGALPMGWIGDRWSAVGMMVIFFVLSGIATILTGFARNPTEMMLGLAAIGLAASIYHPVGIAWLVRNAVARGKALGINGFFGSIGVAGAAGVAGVLCDFVSWRAAFFVPGAVCLLTGIALGACWHLGLVRDRKRDRIEQKPASRQDMWRAFIVLSVTMLCAGLIYQGTLTVMPKLFAERLQGWVAGTASIGTMVMALYLASGLVQVVGGQLSDRFSPKAVYMLMFALQVPLLVLAGVVGGPLIVALMFAINALTVMGAPAESTLITRYSPSQHRSLAFGAKFVLSLGIAPVGIMLVAWVEQATGGFFLLFAILAAFGAVLVTAAMLLPGGREARPAPVAVPAE